MYLGVNYIAADVAKLSVTSPVYGPHITPNQNDENGGFTFHHNRCTGTRLAVLVA